ncbi:Efflux pump rdc3 [Paramyrothecium foliicola]|nr:Efflux pump rdc3 [Paramyrothecium foliicola]
MKLDAPSGSSALAENDRHEPIIVNWEGDDDPANPLNWPTRTKVINTTLISLMAFLTPLASSILAPGVPALMEEFQSVNSALASFVVSVYILGFAAGPLLMAPLSEIYGRSIIYHACNFVFIAFAIACAVAPSLQSLIAFRFLAGIFGSAPITNGTGTIADMDVYNFESDVVGLVFLGLGVGSTVGLALFSTTSDRHARRRAERDGAGPKPEYRLWLLPYAAVSMPVGLFIYGWTAEYSVHWIVPVAAHTFVGFSMVVSIMCVTTYMIDTFTIYAASATAANTVVRSIGGALLPLIGLRFADGPSAKFSTLTAYVEGETHLGTATSWLKLVWEFEETRPYLFGLDAECKEMFEEIKSLKELFRSGKDTAFPFGAPPLTSQTRSQLYSQLPSRRTSQALLEAYWNTFEALFPLWHPPSYFDQIEQFWEDTEGVDGAFLAQIFMMMGLGCQSVSREQSEELGVDVQVLSQSCFNSAKVAFGGSQNTICHGLAGLRTLCMSILARMMDLISFDDEKDCSISIGLAVRTAQSMNMHRHPSLFVGMGEAEMATRIRIWSTLILLDILASIRSSLPPIIHSTGHDACTTLERNRRGEAEHMEDAKSNDAEDMKDKSAIDADKLSFQHILITFLPTAAHIVTMANSANKVLDYTSVKTLDQELRRVLTNAIQLQMRGGTTLQIQRNRLRSEMLQIVVRRIMLILHEPFGRNPDAALNFKPSFIGILECSLALAVSQGVFYKGYPGREMRWALNLFKEDFQIGLVYIALGLRQRSFETGDSEIFHSPPKSIAYITLRRAVEITESQFGNSAKHLFIYVSVLYIVATLDCLESGGSSMRDKMFETGRIVLSTLWQRIKAPLLGFGMNNTLWEKMLTFVE